MRTIGADSDSGIRIAGRLVTTLLVLVVCGVVAGAVVGYLLSRTVDLLLGLFPRG
jgi:hypothetical protein